MFHFFFCSYHKQPLKPVTNAIRLPPTYTSSQPANSSVIDFGAVGYNDWYDTDTIKVAINSCEKSSWCHVIFPPSGTRWRLEVGKDTGRGGDRWKGGGVVSRTRKWNHNVKPKIFSNLKKIENENKICK